LINVRLGCSISPVRFGGHHLDQLMMAGDQGGEFAGGGVEQWSRLRRIISAKYASTSASIRQPAACQSKSPSGPRADFSGDAARVAEIDPICLHIAFRSPEGHDARNAENDWLRAGKRAMCVSIF